MARMNRIVMTGVMPGRSMWRTRWNLDAPSTLAASCRDGSMLARAARYTIMENPAFCQTSEMT